MIWASTLRALGCDLADSWEDWLPGGDLAVKTSSLEDVSSLVHGNFAARRPFPVLVDRDVVLAAEMVKTNLTDGVIVESQSRGWARSGRVAQRPASAFERTPT